MHVEVGVDLQKSAWLDLMQAATTEVRIGNQPLDTRHGFEPQQHLERVHRIQKVADCVRDRALQMGIAEFFLEGIVEVSPLHCVGSWKLPKDAIENSVIE